MELRPRVCPGVSGRAHQQDQSSREPTLHLCSLPCWSCGSLVSVGNATGGCSPSPHPHPALCTTHSHRLGPSLFSALLRTAVAPLTFPFWSSFQHTASALWGGLVSLPLPGRWEWGRLLRGNGPVNDDITRRDRLGVAPPNGPLPRSPGHPA